MKFFGHHNEEKKHRSGGGPILGILRLFLSLFMMAVLVIGGYSAFKHFSGVDPAGVDTKTLIINNVWEIVGSEDLSKIITQLLTFKVPTNINDLKNDLKDSNISESYNQNPLNSEAAVRNPIIRPDAKSILKFALVADSHNSNDKLKDALFDAREKGAKFVIGIGDYTDVGTDKELNEAKAVFEGSHLPYYLTAGDHDLWNARDKGVDPQVKFSEIFGSPYQSFSDSGVRFLILYNADNYQGMDSVQMSWLSDQVDRLNANSPKLTLAFVHEPLYHPSSDHFMGRVTPELKNQAQSILQQLKRGDVHEVFYGDTHFFGRFKDPTTDIQMTTIGALTVDRNAQKPRYAMVEVFDDYQYNVTDIELK